jgi:hypothetical protein
MTGTIALALAGILFLGASPVIAGDGERRLSGRVMEIRPDGNVVIEAQGPWAGPGTGIIRQTVALGPDTLIRVVRPKSSWDQSDVDPGYAITAADFRELTKGDFITVMTRDGSKAVAIDVVRAEGADAGLASPTAESGKK